MEKLLHIEEELKKLNEDLFPFRERVGRISQSMEVHMEKLKEELKRLRLYKEQEEAKRSLEIKHNLKTAYEFKRSIDNIKAQIESKEEELKELRQRITGYEERLKELGYEGEVIEVKEGMNMLKEVLS